LWYKNLIHIPVDLVDDPVHDPLEEIPGEIEGFGCHEICSGHCAQNDDLAGVSSFYSSNSGKTSVAYVAIDSVVTHYAHGPAWVEGCIGLGDLVVEACLADLADENLTPTVSTGCPICNHFREKQRT
jgi:hypothetical protein